MGAGWYNSDALPQDAIGLKLHRMIGERLVACETVIFKDGRRAVDTTLRRAAISGRVEVEGKLEDHWADVIVDESGTWTASVALDAKSYRSLKTHWMRCKTEPS